MSKTPTLEERAGDIVVAASALSQPYQRVSYVRGVTLEHLRAVEAEGRAVERERCARIAEAHKHILHDEDQRPEDFSARYSNRTCDLIASAIRDAE